MFAILFCNNNIFVVVVYLLWYLWICKQLIYNSSSDSKWIGECVRLCLCVCLILRCSEVSEFWTPTQSAARCTGSYMKVIFNILVAFATWTNPTCLQRIGLCLYIVCVSVFFVRVEHRISYFRKAYGFHSFYLRRKQFLIFRLIRRKIKKWFLWFLRWKWMKQMWLWLMIVFRMMCDTVCMWFLCFFVL